MQAKWSENWPAFTIPTSPQQGILTSMTYSLPPWLHRHYHSMRVVVILPPPSGALPTSTHIQWPISPLVVSSSGETQRVHSKQLYPGVLPHMVRMAPA